MKWIFISIVILYLFLMPFNTFQHYNTYSLNNILAVAYRVSILVVIIFSVNLLILTTSKEEIISALFLLLKPLTYFGVDIDSFLIRAYLTLEFVDKLNGELKRKKQSAQIFFPFIASWLEQSMLDNRDKISIKKINYPKLIQYLIPVLLCFCYIVILMSESVIT